MARSICSSEENIVRAVCTAHWDSLNNRISSNLFEGVGTSVSRLQILPIETIVEILERELGGDKMVGMREINVGVLQGIGRAYEHPIELTVEADPTDTNIAHAEIPQNITKGLSKRIIKALKPTS